MKGAVLIVIASTCIAVPTGFAQESVSGNEGASSSQAAEERELTRAERRELRRSERETRNESARADTVGAAETDDEGIICRREPVIGSHRRIRICTTRAERDASREAAQETLREVTRQQGPLGTEGG